jgi:hypothetical protein
MIASRFTRIGLLWIFVTAFALSPRCEAQSTTTLSWIAIGGADGSYNFFFEEAHVVGPLGPIPETNAYQGPLVAITNRGANVPFQGVGQSSFLRIYQAHPDLPLDSVGETFTLFDGNVSTNIYVELNPLFLTQPQSQSLFVGSNATFTAQAVHSTGYQWQLNGTNLIENGHFSGVSNSTLNITSVTTNDAGTYTVIAEHPAAPRSSLDAVLSVFKPLQLSVAGAAPPGFVRILAGNADQSPFEASRASNVQLYFTTDLGVSFTNGVLCTNSILLTNGLLQCDFFTGGTASGFWQIVEQP